MNYMIIFYKKINFNNDFLEKSKLVFAWYINMYLQVFPAMCIISYKVNNNHHISKTLVLFIIKEKKKKKTGVLIRFFHLIPQ